MGVGRTTVQGIYSRARKNSRIPCQRQGALIEGGEYRLCEGMGTGCGRAATDIGTGGRKTMQLLLKEAVGQNHDY